jgi:hypothetical protein
MPVVAFLIVRPDRSPDRGPAQRLSQSQTVSRPRPRPLVDATQTPWSIERSEFADARASARAFLATYLAYLHRRGPVHAIAHAAPELLRALARHSVRLTPAQQQARPRQRALSVAVQAGGSVRAVATLQDPGGPPYPLLLYLEWRGTVWTVTRLGDV